MKNMNRKVISLTLIVSLIAIGLGHFLFEFGIKQKTEDSVIEIESVEKAEEVRAVNYRHISTEINNNRQEIDVLEIDLSTGSVELFPALSHNSVFGFEELSKLAIKNNAYAAINGGFFYEYGDPSGMVVIDGRILTKSTGKYPVFTIKDKKAQLAQIENEMFVIHNGNKINVSELNRMCKPGNVILYTSDFGLNNRADISNTSIVIENNKVTEVAKSKASTVIPKSGMVLTFYEPYNYDFNAFPIKQGDIVEVICKPEITKDMQAYECGSWLIKDGNSVAPNKDDWVGLLTNYDPRTAVGIKRDGTVVLMTVDGRQPGYSVGVSAKELANFLIEYGVKDAAMLDGGASTEMILNGKIINKPSYKGSERPLGGALIIRVNQ